MPQCVVTDESHGRRAIFPATQRAVVLWALACVVRSTGMVLIQALRSRFGQHQTPLGAYHPIYGTAH